MARLPGKIKAGGTGQPTKEGRDAQRPDFPGWYARDDIPDAGYDNDLATVKAVRDNGGGGGGAVDSVNGQTGDVVLDADDVGALESGDNISLLTNDAGYLATVASDSSLTGNGTAGSPLSVVGGGGAVDSVNGQTGVVVLDADDVGALATVATDATLTGDGTTGSPLSVVGGGGAVTSVNGQTGNVILDADDVGALENGDNVSELVNDAGYLAAVSSDATLTGDGTAGSPLSVVSSGGSLSVSDGTTTVNNVTSMQFTKANSVTDLTGGAVSVNNDAGGGGGGVATYSKLYLVNNYTPPNNSTIPMVEKGNGGSGITYSAADKKWTVTAGAYHARFYSAVATAATFASPILYIDQFESDGTTLKERHPLTRPEGNQFELQGSSTTIVCEAGDVLQFRYLRSGTSAGVMRGSTSNTDWTWATLERLSGS